MDSCAEKDAQREWQKRQNPQSVPPKKNRNRFNCHLLRNWFSVHKQQQACFTIILPPRNHRYRDRAWCTAHLANIYWHCVPRIVDCADLLGRIYIIWIPTFYLAMRVDVGQTQNCQTTFCFSPIMSTPTSSNSDFFLKFTWAPRQVSCNTTNQKTKKSNRLSETTPSSIYGRNFHYGRSKNQQNSYLLHGWLILATHKCTFWNFHSICFIHHRCMEEEDKPYIHTMMMIWWWVSSWKMNNVNWHFFFNDW
jgi:hypothetical protein